jgi:putative exosortase-associated protein (TIGR04073 family)
MKGIIASGLIVLMIMSSCSLAFGAEKKEGTAYTKGERGFKNVVLGWTEIPKSIVNTSKKKNILIGLTVGTLEGIVNAFARTVSGTADFATMPVGSYKKQPIKPQMIDTDK